MNILQSTERYEKWLEARMPIIREDLQHKHVIMAEDPFVFLRGTFYQWVERFPQICDNLMDAPTVLGVGDLHVDNFGTWRDLEGRLVWGINDFDEACVIPCVNDLVRLATSTALALEQNHLHVKFKDACETIMEGYLTAMEKDGKPFILAERHEKLRNMAFNDFRNPSRYWRKMNELPVVNLTPDEPGSILTGAFADPNMTIKVHHRVAGVGSLGHPRYTAIAEWKGGWVAREAKSLVESSWYVQKDFGKKHPSLYSTILKTSVRSQDPYFQIISGWIIRRLAPDCSRIEITSLPKNRDELHLLFCMGWETANIHIGDKQNAPNVYEYIRRLPAGWLQSAAQMMMKDTLKDWNIWKSSPPAV